MVTVHVNNFVNCEFASENMSKMDWKHFYHDTTLANFASCLIFKKIEAMF